MKNLDHIEKNQYEKTQFHGHNVSLTIINCNFRRNLLMVTKMFYDGLIQFEMQIPKILVSYMQHLCFSSKKQKTINVLSFFVITGAKLKKSIIFYDGRVEIITRIRNRPSNLFYNERIKSKKGFCFELTAPLAAAAFINLISQGPH